MAGKPKSMRKVKQLLRLHKKGGSRRSVARMPGMIRITLKAYLNRLLLMNAVMDEFLKLEAPFLEKQFYIGNTEKN